MRKDNHHFKTMASLGGTGEKMGIWESSKKSVNYIFGMLHHVGNGDKKILRFSKPEQMYILLVDFKHFILKSILEIIIAQCK